jgi:diguanylate cyclase (GGDEF)-like protein/PAS domain S-box-containing protein
MSHTVFSAGTLSESQKDGVSMDTPFDQRLIDCSPDGILGVDPQGCIFMVNAALCALTGYATHELVGSHLDVLLPPTVRGGHGRHLVAFFQQPHARAMGNVPGLALWHREGWPVAVDIALGQAHRDGEICALAFIRDVRDMLEVHRRMEFQATHDALTRLPNRRLFAELLRQAVSQGQRTGHSLAVLLVDLDDFKGINDGYGHAVGDLVLQEVAHRLMAILREADSVARLGGDEFAILVRDLKDPSDALLVAQKVVHALGVVFRVNHFTVYPGASVGVVYAPQDAEDVQTLMRFVDMAMYQAKENGRGTYATYSPSMSYRLEEKILLHERLKQALDNGLLTLHYQPQVEVLLGQMTGVEALLRWHDSELGDVSPERFIPVAESTGLMQALGDWVLETACRQIATWHQQGLNLRVAVNVSVQQFRQRDLVDRVSFLLQRWQVPPHLLELEVTESVAMIDTAQAAAMLGQLTALGVSVALDDFGMGHSSLAYLRDLPVSRLKIDRTFIRGVMHSDSDAVLAKAVIGLARTLGKTVVAEGVETQEQLDFLCQNNCQSYQGWLFSKAVAASDVPMLLRLLPPVGVSEWRQQA